MATTPPTPPGGLPPGRTGFVPQSDQPVTKFTVQGIAPPSNLYIARDDTLVITATSPTTAITLTVQGRLLRAADGVISPFQQNIVLPASRTATVATIQLAEGFLLNVAAFTTANPSPPGNVYVTINQQRPGTPSPNQFSLLASGYVGSARAIGWPGGPIARPIDGAGFLRSITGTVPAAGAEVSETVPTLARWQLLSLRVNLVTSATVATRIPQFVFDDGANEFYRTANNAGGYGASNTIQVALANTSLVTTAVGTALAPIPMTVPIILEQGFRIRTVTIALQGTDQYNALFYEVMEWLEEF